MQFEGMKMEDDQMFVDVADEVSRHALLAGSSTRLIPLLGRGDRQSPHPSRGLCERVAIAAYSRRMPLRLAIGGRERRIC